MLAPRGINKEIVSGGNWRAQSMPDWHAAY